MVVRCDYCGYPIRENETRCMKCHTPVQMVPDYNSFDDYLVSELQEKRGLEADADMRRALAYQEQRSRKRRHLEKRRKARLRRKIKACLILIGILLVIAGVAFGIYRVSYKGLSSRGESALRKGNLKQAQTLFERAIKKDNTKSRAYAGLSNVYLASKQAEKGEGLYLNALKKQPQNVELYEGLIQYYIASQDTEKIPEVLEGTEKGVKEMLKEYQISPPKFSLKDEESFDEVQELTLSSKDGYQIYYTLDGKKPTLKSKKYKGAILLEEGKTKVTAIAVDERGVPSLPAKKNLCGRFTNCKFTFGFSVYRSIYKGKKKLRSKYRRVILHIIL